MGTYIITIQEIAETIFIKLEIAEVNPDASSLY